MCDVDLARACIDNMKHAIGFRGNKVKRGKYEAYRNYYASNGKDADWEWLVKLGFAREREPIGNEYTYYYVTRPGLEYLEKLLEVRIFERE